MSLKKWPTYEEYSRERGQSTTELPPDLGNFLYMIFWHKCSNQNLLKL